MKDTHIHAIIRSLETENWQFINNTTNINTAYDNFISKIHNIIDRHAPTKTISINNKNLIRKPWLSRGIINSAKTRDKLFKKCMGKPRDSTEYQKYLTYRNILNSTKRKSKQPYNGKLLIEYRKDIRKNMASIEHHN